jgi:hypothetical protein
LPPQDFLALSTALQVYPSPLPRSTIETAFRAANNDRQRFRGLGGDDMDERSLCFWEFLEACVLLADTAFASEKVEAAGADKTLGVLGAFTKLCRELLAPLAKEVGGSTARLTLKDRPLLSFLSSNLAALERVFKYYAVPAAAGRLRRQVNASAWAGSGGAAAAAATAAAASALRPGASPADGSRPLLRDAGLFVNSSRVVLRPVEGVGEPLKLPPPFLGGAGAAASSIAPAPAPAPSPAPAPAPPATPSAGAAKPGSGAPTTPPSAAGAGALAAAATPAVKSRGGASAAASPAAAPPASPRPPQTPGGPAASPRPPQTPGGPPKAPGSRGASRAGSPRAAAAAAAAPPPPPPPPPPPMPTDPAAFKHVSLPAFLELLSHAGLCLDASTSASAGSATAKALVDIAPYIAELSGRRRAEKEPPFLVPAPGRIAPADAVRAYWGAVGTPNPGERPAPGLTLPQLVEAVARVALNKWGPGTGMCLGWMVKLSEREKAAYMLHLGRAKGGPLAPALPFLDAALLPCCHRIFAEWALRRVCDVAGALGAQPSAEQVSATRENPLDAVAVAEAERAGGGLGTALLSALKRKGLPLPGRPDFPVGFSTLPQPVVTLAPENVLHKSEAWKRKEAMTTRIAPPSQ